MGHFEVGRGPDFVTTLNLYQLHRMAITEPDRIRIRIMLYFQMSGYGPGNYELWANDWVRHLEQICPFTYRNTFMASKNGLTLNQGTLDKWLTEFCGENNEI